MHCHAGSAGALKTSLQFDRRSLVLLRVQHKSLHHGFFRPNGQTGLCTCCRFAFPALKPPVPFHTSTGAQPITDVLRSDEAAAVGTCPASCLPCCMVLGLLGTVQQHPPVCCSCHKHVMHGGTSQEGTLRQTRSQLMLIIKVCCLHVACVACWILAACRAFVLLEALSTDHM